jgi:hypothetical protein
MRRKLRIIKRVPPIVGLCEACDVQFKSIYTEPATAQVDIKASFAAHDCKPVAQKPPRR